MSTRSILVFESLLADTAAWQSARPSMQTEALTMLQAIVEDFLRIPGVEPVVLASSAATHEILRRRPHWSPHLLQIDSGPLAWLREPTHSPDSFAATFVIAPECDGLLPELLEMLQTGVWHQVPSLNLDFHRAAIFSDKYETAQWLQEHGIATPPVWLIEGPEIVASCAAVDAVNFERRGHSPLVIPRELQSHRSGGHRFVVKPRDGVGCDRVHLLCLDEEPRMEQAGTADSSARWILQPCIQGTHCSVGLIGTGSGHSLTNCPTTILLPAEQQILLASETFTYRGGRIPCRSELLEPLSSAARQVANALGPFRGYLGVDLVVPEEQPQNAVVIEINPRLCTSYAGYRALARENLAGLILDGSPVPSWAPGTVWFDAAGRISRDGLHSQPEPDIQSLMQAQYRIE